MTGVQTCALPVLDEIICKKKKFIEIEKMVMPQKQLFSQIKDKRDSLDFKEAIKNKKGLSIIAEVKRASPSKGIIREDFNPLKIAEIYQQSKVEAISVLTEETFFQGSHKYLSQIREKTNIPLLRKDFIIDSYQIYQSKVLGADGILLIVAALDRKELDQIGRASCRERV